jgi:hypothetical protein
MTDIGGSIGPRFFCRQVIEALEYGLFLRLFFNLAASAFAGKGREKRIFRFQTDGRVRPRKKVHAGYDYVMGLCPYRSRNGRKAPCAGMPQPLASLPFQAIGGPAVSWVMAEALSVPTPCAASDLAG